MFESIANQKDIEFTSLFPDEDVVGYFDKIFLKNSREFVVKCFQIYTFRRNHPLYVG